MARISLSQQLADLREHCIKIEQENTNLRSMLQRQPAARSTVPSFSERARAYCAANNVRSVPAAVVAEWRAGH